MCAQISDSVINGDYGSDFGAGVLWYFYSSTWMGGPLLWLNKQFVNHTMVDKFGRTIGVRKYDPLVTKPAKNVF
jgi:hypothetical protein